MGPQRRESLWSHGQLSPEGRAGSWPCPSNEAAPVRSHSVSGFGWIVGGHAWTSTVYGNMARAATHSVFCFMLCRVLFLFCFRGSPQLKTFFYKISQCIDFRKLKHSLHLRCCVCTRTGPGGVVCQPKRLWHEETIRLRMWDI